MGSDRRTKFNLLKITWDRYTPNTFGISGISFEVFMFGRSQWDIPSFYKYHLYTITLVRGNHYSYPLHIREHSV